MTFVLWSRCFLVKPSSGLVLSEEYGCCHAKPYLFLQVVNCELLSVCACTDWFVDTDCMIIARFWSSFDLLLLLSSNY